MIKRAAGVFISVVCLTFISVASSADQSCPVKKGESIESIQGNTQNFVVHISNIGGAVRSLFLYKNQYLQGQDESPTGSIVPPAEKLAAGPLDLVTTWDTPLYPLNIEFQDLSPIPVVRTCKLDPDSGTVNEDFLAAFIRDPIFTVVSRSDDTVVMVWPDPVIDISPLYIERTYTVSDDYVVDSSIRLVNVGETEINGQLKLMIPSWESAASNSSAFCGGMLGAPPDEINAVCRSAGKIERKTRKELLDKKNFETVDVAQYAGITTRYFLSAAIPAEGSITQCVAAASEIGVVNTVLRWGNESGGQLLIKAAKEGGCIPDWLGARADMAGRVICGQAAASLGVKADVSASTLAEMATAGLSTEQQAARHALMNQRDRSFAFKFFAGPKDLDLLKKVSPGLEDTIDFGWFTVLAKPMLWFMRFVHGYIPSWGFAIIMLTILVKLLTFPFTHSSMKQMRRMAELKPRVEELQKKYKDDKAKLNQATMEMYKREKINPMGGCLPMLIQMPIWIALYRTIYSAVDLYQAPLGLWIHDLSSQDPYFVLPLLLGVIMFINQKLTPVTGDQTQAKMMLWMMPIMFTGMMLFLPSGLVFYILINTVLSIFQTLWTNRGLKAKLASTR
jgi:YidC/Oxa1 family membrane protein insertase